MPSSLVKTVNFGRTKSGLTTSVGYRLIDATGLVAQERRQVDVYETFTGTGIYAASIIFPDDFTGTILWDIEGDRPVYAAEEFNNSINGTGVSQQVADVTMQVGIVTDQVTDLADEIRFIRGMTAGRWTLDSNDSTMTFYDESGRNVLVTYEMFDARGRPSLESVYDRRIKRAIPMIMSLSGQQNITAGIQVSGSI
jgi:hypothetical protein